MANIDDFEKIDIRVGKIIEIKDFPEARKPAYQMKIDFGEKIGIKQSAGQFTVNYSKDELLNKLVLGVVNFPPRQIGPFISEVLTVGVADEKGEPTLVVPTKNIPLGGRLY